VELFILTEFVSFTLERMSQGGYEIHFRSPLGRRSNLVGESLTVPAPMVVGLYLPL
jgi:hypothetical protein